MINSAFKARLLLRPSHQRTVLFGTVYRPLILSSRTYSESESVQRSQSSRHEDEDKDQSSKTKGQSSKAKHQIPSLWTTIGIGIGVTGGIIVRAGLFYVPFRIC